MRAKVTGSNNPLNTVRACFKGLTSQVRVVMRGSPLLSELCVCVCVCLCLQESFQELADRTGRFVVEYRRECLDRPVVVAMPTTTESGRGQAEGVWQELRDLQLVPKTAHA